MERARQALLAALCSASCLAACGSPEASSPATAPAATREERWAQDLDTLARDLARLHANLFFKTPPAEFDRAVDELRRAIPTLTDEEVVVGLMRIGALPGDAHTGVSALGWGGFRRYPLQVGWFDDGLLVTATTPEWARGRGARILSVDGVAAPDLLTAVAPVLPHENAAWLLATSPNVLVVPEILHAQGVVQDRARARCLVETAEAERVLLEIPAVLRSEVGTMVDAAPGLPLYRQRPEENYWLHVDRAEGLVYVKYNRCRNGAEAMTAFAPRVFAEVDRAAPRALVIDVRDNTGGDSSVLDPFLAGLRARGEIAGGRRLFTIIGRATFSSGLLNAITLKHDHGAILVGEPTGGKPNGYGEVRSFTLPNSGLSVGYSTRFFRLLPDDPPWLAPDVTVTLTSADYLAGRDPVLEAILDRLAP
jgi:hypothetical protein